MFTAACAQLPTAGDATIAARDNASTEREAAAAESLAAPQPAETALAARPQEIAAGEGAAGVARELARPVSLWERVRAGFSLPELSNPLVREWEEWYSSRPDYVARMVERSSRYLYYIVEEVQRRGMPTEIALLPMIESAYNPQAYSRSRASGIWQFIPSTGKLYGLRQNWWHDGRRDILAATNAALDYLEKLYGMFGSWDLALAAYNWGEGAVSRAIARNQARGLAADYESLTMPAETRAYVPKLQAVKNIVADPARFGLALADIPNEPYFAVITTDRHIDVRLAAKLAELPIDEFRSLNPGHNKPVIKADGSETIVLPKEKIGTFLNNLAKHDGPLVSWQAYTVKRGDRPEKIAAKYGITLAKLKEINGINGRRKITPGMPLLVPAVGTAEPHLPDLPAPSLAKMRVRKAKPALAARNKARAVRKAGYRGGKKLVVQKTGAKRVKVIMKPTARGGKKIVLAQNRRNARDR
ncbi:MAG: transglycosylase SLT domain-containing protein [Betaproteobacteria bacterium]|nr:transglycosylase SLT domain-containing protein [Betaproteobacteria bacterium]